MNKIYFEIFFRIVTEILWIIMKFVRVLSESTMFLKGELFFLRHHENIIDSS